MHYSRQSTKQYVMGLLLLIASVTMAHGFGVTLPSKARLTTRGGAFRASTAASMGDLTVSNDDEKYTTLPGTPLFVKSESFATKNNLLVKIVGGIGSFWGSIGFAYALAKAVKRVLPIALEPFTSDTMILTPFQWSIYALNILFFAYYEGYKGFQAKTSPLVVKRSFALMVSRNPFIAAFQYIFAPFYSGGLFGATRKRMIVSWSINTMVAAIVIGVKKLPQPWRSIIDGGVVVGLSWGAASIVAIYFHSWWKRMSPPNTDPCL